MSVRKYVAGAALAGALGVAAVGMAGTASADRGYDKNKGGTEVSCNVLSCNKSVDKSTTTIDKSKTATTGNINVGNIQQNAGALNGVVNNPQLNAGNNATSGSVTNTATSKQGKQLILLGIPVQSTHQGGTTGAASNDNVSSNSANVNSATSSHNSVNVNK